MRWGVLRTKKKGVVLRTKGGEKGKKGGGFREEGSTPVRSQRTAWGQWQRRYLRADALIRRSTRGGGRNKEPQRGGIANRNRKKAMGEQLALRLTQSRNQNFSLAEHRVMCYRKKGVEKG